MSFTIYTQEEIEKAKHIRAVVNGSKGGKSGWNKLSQKQKDERISKMISSRKKSKKEAQEPELTDPTP